MTVAALKIFISYASVNRWQVQTLLVETLRSGGYEPWIDLKLTPGKPFLLQLSAVLKSVDTVIYAVSPDSLSSEWCQWEIKQVVELCKPIIPVILQKKLEIPDWIREIHWVDFSDGPTPHAVAQLLLAVREATVSTPTIPINVPDTPSSIPIQFAHDTLLTQSDASLVDTRADAPYSERSIVALRLGDVAQFLPSLRIPDVKIEYISWVKTDMLRQHSALVVVLPLTNLLTAELVSILKESVPYLQWLIVIFVRNDDQDQRNQDYDLFRRHQAYLQQRLKMDERSVMLVTKRQLTENGYTYWRSLLQGWIRDSHS